MALWQKLRRELEKLREHPVVPPPAERRRRDPVPEPEHLPPLWQDPAPEVRVPRQGRRD